MYFLVLMMYIAIIIVIILLTSYVIFYGDPYTALAVALITILYSALEYSVKFAVPREISGGDEIEGGGGKYLGTFTEKEIFRLVNDMQIGEFVLNHKPKWLYIEDKISGNKINLELDIYNKMHRVAIEYNGPQHYKYNKKYWKNMYLYAKYIQNSLAKKRICEENGVDLIVIPYTVSNKVLKDYIKSRLADLPYFQGTITPTNYIEAVKEPEIEKLDEVMDMVVSRDLRESFRQS